MGLLHASILNVLPNTQLTALCEKSGMIRRLFKKAFKQVQIVDDVEKFVDLDLDAVFVTTPIPSHFSITKTVYVGKIARNLFVEKTLASSYDNAKELCELAERFGGVNMVGYLRRFAVTFQKAKDLLVQGRIGEASSFEAYAHSSDFLESKNDQDNLAARGGVLSDLGCHAVDLALWFFGDLYVASEKPETISDRSLGNAVRFKVRKREGLVGQFDVSWCVKGCRMPEVGLSISGSEGAIEVNDDKVELRLKTGESLRWYRQDLKDNVSFWVGAPEYFREDEYFTKSIIENRSAEPSFRTASKVDEIIDQVKIQS
jgi:predicted dehydrogenase